MLGDTTFGATTVGETTIGETTVGATSLGVTTVGATSAGVTTVGATTVGVTTFGITMVGATHGTVCASHWLAMTLDEPTGATPNAKTPPTQSVIFMANRCNRTSSSSIVPCAQTAVLDRSELHHDPVEPREHVRGLG